MSEDTKTELKGWQDDDGYWYRTDAQFTLFQVIEGKARGIMKMRDGKVFIRHDQFVGYEKPKQAPFDIDKPKASIFQQLKKSILGIRRS